MNTTNSTLASKHDLSTRLVGADSARVTLNNLSYLNEFAGAGAPVLIKSRQKITQLTEAPVEAMIEHLKVMKIFAEQAKDASLDEHQAALLEQEYRKVLESIHA